MMRTEATPKVKTPKLKLKAPKKKTVKKTSAKKDSQIKRKLIPKVQVKTFDIANEDFKRVTLTSADAKTDAGVAYINVKDISVIIELPSGATQLKMEGITDNVNMIIKESPEFLIG